MIPEQQQHRTNNQIQYFMPKKGNIKLRHLARWVGYSEVDNKQSKWSSETNFLSGTGATNVELNGKNVEDFSILNAV